MRTIIAVILLLPASVFADVEMRYSDGTVGLISDGRVVFGDDEDKILYEPGEEGLIDREERRGELRLDRVLQQYRRRLFHRVTDELREVATEKAGCRNGCRHRPRQLPDAYRQQCKQRGDDQERDREHGIQGQVEQEKQRDRQPGEIDCETVDVDRDPAQCDEHIRNCLRC